MREEGEGGREEGVRATEHRRPSAVLVGAAMTVKRLTVGLRLGVPWPPEDWPLSKCPRIIKL